MRTTFSASTLLVGVLTVSGLTASMGRAQGQQKPEQDFQLSSADLALTFTTERTKVTPGTGGNFWLRGGSLDAGFTLFHGFGVAGNLTGEEAGNIAPGVNLVKMAIMAGPRYTFHVGGKHENRFFAEALFGGAYAHDGIFPSSNGLKANADSFSLQVGGGWDVAISKAFAIRVIEADYVRTGLPNYGSNSQDDLRLAFGVAYHLQRH